MNAPSNIVQVAEQRDEFFLDVDGFVYYWPSNSQYGCLSANHLRELADELDLRNKAWNDYITENLKPTAE